MTRRGDKEKRERGTHGKFCTYEPWLPFSLFEGQIIQIWRFLKINENSIFESLFWRYLS